MLTPVATLDAAMLIAETAEMPLHNLGVLRFEPPPDSAQSAFESMRAMIGARLHRVPAFRRKLVQGPLRLGDLQWVEDAEVDLGRHLFRTRLPSPGRGGGAPRVRRRLRGALAPARQAAVGGGARRGAGLGRARAVAKIHHATMDGSKLAALLGDLFDHSPSETALPPAPQVQHGSRDPGVVRLALTGARSLAAKPGRVTHAAVDVASALMRRRGAASGSGVPSDVASFRVPPTPWGGALSTSAWWRSLT
jgi:diacylglycerol O-acyltransferase